MKNANKSNDLPSKSIWSHEAKMGLFITLLVLIGVLIWVLVELKMYQP